MISSVYILNTLVILGVVLCALLAATFKKTLSSVIAMAGCGAFMSLEFILLHAPDVAIAEAAVGVVITTIIFVVTLRKTGGEDEK
ncbi:MAG: hydrogenase subunit MbhD domain-containing protein [Oscillospiraceae bacterium]